MRFGDIATFRWIAPIMRGMILGEFMMAVFWAVMSTKSIGYAAPRFPWW